MEKALDNMLLWCVVLQLTTLEKSSRQLEDEKRELMANLNVSLNYTYTTVHMLVGQGSVVNYFHRGRRMHRENTSFITTCVSFALSLSLCRFVGGC